MGGERQHPYAMVEEMSRFNGAFTVYWGAERGWEMFDSKDQSRGETLK